MRSKLVSKPRAVRRRAAVAVLAAAVLVLGACSSGDDGDPVAAGGLQGGSGGGDTLAFYECLRENGLDVPDPEQPGMISLEGIDADDPAHMEIVDECRELLDGVMGGGEMADTEALVEFAACMREQGIDMPDPDGEGNLGLPDGFDPDSPEQWQGAFQDAAGECSEHLGGGGIRIGEPGGGGQMGGRQP